MSHIVQSNSAFVTTPTTFTPALLSTSLTGSTIFLLTSNSGGANTFTLPAGWLRVVDNTDGNAPGLNLFYYPNAPPGTTFGIFTQSFGSNLSYTMWEDDRTLTLDKTGSATSGATTVTTLTCTPAATTKAVEVVIAGFGVSGAAAAQTWVAPTGFTLIKAQDTNTTAETIASFQEVTSTGTYAATQLETTTAQTKGIIGTFYVMAAPSASSPSLAILPRRFVPASRRQRPFISAQRLAYPQLAAASTPITAAETATVGDLPTNILIDGGIPESIAVADAASTIQLASVAEAATAADLPTNVSLTGPAESATVTEGAVVAVVTFIAAADTVAVTESATVTVLAAETITGADAASKILLAGPNESATATDTPTVIGLSTADTVSAADAASIIMVVAVDTATATDAASKLLLAGPNEAGTAADLPSIIGLSGLGDTATVADTFGNIVPLGGTTPSSADAATVTEGASIVAFIAATEAITAADLPLQIGLTRAETAALAEAGTITLAGVGETVLVVDAMLSVVPTGITIHRGKATASATVFRDATVALVTRFGFGFDEGTFDQSAVYDGVGDGGDSSISMTGATSTATMTEKASATMNLVTRFNLGFDEGTFDQSALFDGSGGGDATIDLEG